MLRTLDILIGATTVILMFALAVTVLTQAVTNVLGRKGAHLLDGLSGLLAQLGVDQAVAARIASALLRHPMLSPGRSWSGRFHLGNVIHREELTKLLLEAASGLQPGMWTTLDDSARKALVTMFKNNGIADPGEVLRQIRLTAMHLEGTHPELASDVRESMAILHVASSDYVARLNSWFDQTIDRVSQRFARHTHAVTVGLATILVLSVQLDMVAVVNRLSVDDALRQKIVSAAANDDRMNAGAAGTSPDASPNAAKETTKQAPADASIAASPDASKSRARVEIEDHDYYTALGDAGLITFPFSRHWRDAFDPRKIPGMAVAILLISLGAPFWYNILKDLLGLRSVLARKDDQQRAARQTTQEVAPSVAGLSIFATKQPSADLQL